MSDDSVQPGGVALRDPFYGAPFAEAVRRFWRKYTVFTGRASRAEFWWWWITSFAIGLVLQLVPQVFAPNTRCSRTRSARTCSCCGDSRR
ncbi:DUF805 domain-containing protein [Curtobacterium flaccumfaciens]|nr:DUF805 domain-containing protein [Curtobacterium flaccumfaciens]